jgi:flavin reductase (DIM6/NTAB) family NADH-FMN oxidoreductase RutF
VTRPDADEVAPAGAASARVVPPEGATGAAGAAAASGAGSAALAVDGAAFREALARFASGVTVVTARGPQGAPVGFTATAFSSLSLDPPLILVCLSRSASTYPAFLEATHFAVNVLAAGQAAAALRFAARGTDRFAGATVEPGPATGLPLLPGAAVHLECRTYRRVEAGDHVILLGEVLRAARTDADPLVHFNRQFGGFAPPEPAP